MKRLVFILIGLGGLVALGFYLVQLSEPQARDNEMGNVFEPHPAAITVLCSDEKEEWIRKAASDFGRRRPDIDIKVKSMSSVDGLNAILSRQMTPTVWSPSESSMLQYMLYRWRQEFGVALFELTGEDAPRSLARSPIVWLSWKTRIDAITAAVKADQIKPDSVWADIGCAGVPHDPDAEWPAVPARWDSLAALKPAGRQPAANPLSAWGDVKFFHPDPTRSNVGFHAIYLMAYQFLGEPDQMTVPMLDGDAFLTWFRRCQRLRKDFPISVQTLTNRLFQFGPDEYDIVVTYENLALKNMLSATARWAEQPYVYYPPVTTWADHPAVILNSAELPRDQREAARDWISFLLSPDRQRSLITFGLRPVLRKLSVQDQRVDNPFTTAARFNIQIDPVFQSPPGLSGEAIDRLIEIWREATGYY